MEKAAHVPNVILIEWSESLALFINDWKTVWSSKIPADIHDLLLKTDRKTMVLHWYEEILDDLYTESNFDDFAENTKSLLADRLPVITDKTVFIFGTKKVIRRTQKAICNRRVPPMRTFSYGLYESQDSSKGDIYLVNDRDDSMSLLQKVTSSPVRQLVNPHPK